VYIIGLPGIFIALLVSSDQTFQTPQQYKSWLFWDNTWFGYMKYRHKFSVNGKNVGQLEISDNNKLS